MAVTEHMGRKFDWRPRFDEASKLFRVRPPDAAPISYTALTWRAPTVLDQGNTGTCVGHGHAGAIGANPLSRPISSELALSLYDTALPLDEWPDAEQGRDSGTSVLAGAKAGVQLGYYEGYDWGFSLSDLLYGVAKRPAVIGVNWYEGMMTPDENGIIRPTGNNVGGHCVLVRGVAVQRAWVRVRNSWGPGWGPLGGDARILWSDFERLISEEAEICFPREIAA